MVWASSEGAPGETGGLKIVSSVPGEGGGSSEDGVGEAGGLKILSSVPGDGGVTEGGVGTLGVPNSELIPPEIFGI
jgi:hypothetical protein